MSNNTLVQAENLCKTFLYRKAPLHAVNDVNLNIHRGETLGIAGESGCGKSTLGRMLLGLETPTAGKVLFEGDDINKLGGTKRFLLRRKMQMIFQDPYTSLNPLMTIEAAIGEGIAIHNLLDKEQRQQKIIDLLHQVGLDETALHRYPHEFSGGQRQRIGIARALAVDPDFIVCDEPLSALDMRMQVQIIDLLKTLQQQRFLAYLFISHDLHAIRAIAHNVAIMYLGSIVESAPTTRFFASPAHPYSQVLINAIPTLDTTRHPLPMLKGEPASPLSIPVGCPFHPRCPKAQPLCRQQRPVLQEVAPGHLVACHYKV